ncbi:MAG: type II toxin-antitoxin system MqsA family antitoxin [Zoogloeaceae bacterium]|jgi:HTH-type transcriptional regulator/antitoxin MqsA|nr:type II toxin-antitoxin system MqsA family antitoxin [Zoogloeaceae bacterium]
MSVKFCLQCDDGTRLEHRKKDMTETMGGMSMTVPAVSGWHCPVCGECELDPGEGARVAAALEELRRASIENRARELREIRKKLGLKQADAGRIFGGGVNAFSEYERGKTQPHKSTVLLLKLLDHHPELMREIQEAA